MNLDLLTANPSLPTKSSLFTPFSAHFRTNYTSSNPSLRYHRTFSNPNPKPVRLFKISALSSLNSSDSNSKLNHSELHTDWKFEMRNPNVPLHVPSPGLSLSDQAFFLLAFIACTTSVAFAGFVIAAVPALYAMGKAAISLSKLADTLREELPSTMTAIRLSGMEISDLTLELTDLSQEISDGVNKSAKVVQAAGAGIKQISSLARHQTMSAAKKTSYAVGQASKTLINLISRTDLNTTEINEDGNAPVDRLDVQ